MSRYLRTDINNMQGYVPGEQPQGTNVIKLNTNENPYAPPAAVLKALASVTEAMCRKYPPSRADALRQALAGVYGISVSQLIVGNGSDELLTMIMRAAVNPGEAIAFPEPTYTLYHTLAEIQGASVEEYPFTSDFDFDPAVLKKSKAKVFFLANPNAPSGTVLPIVKVAQMAKNFSGLFVVDEAYADFAEDNALRLLKEYDNVLILRTMSKSCSLAGLRLGWAAAAPELINGLMKIKDSYNVNIATQQAALAVLAHKKDIDVHVEKIKITRQRVAKELATKGWVVYPSQTNFIWAKPPCSAVSLYEHLKQEQIYIRYFAQHPHYLRVSIGTDAEMDQFLQKTHEYLLK